jgi:hypothetical protein
LTADTRNEYPAALLAGKPGIVAEVEVDIPSLKVVQVVPLTEYCTT